MAVPFRFMLLGTGFYARKWLEAVKARRDCEVVAIASRSAARSASPRPT
jgi:predicted dehydrogenase